MANGMASLSRLMANTGDPKSSRRRLLMAAVQSVLLYGVEVWADSLDRKIYRKELAQIQRRSALHVTSAYSTVSDSAVLVVAGIMTIHLITKDRLPQEEELDERHETRSWRADIQLGSKESEVAGREGSSNNRCSRCLLYTSRCV